MLGFELTDDHRLLERSVREWAAREVAPRLHDLDRAHRFDPVILAQMASLELLGISVPAEYGGAGPGLRRQQPPPPVDDQPQR